MSVAVNGLTNRVIGDSYDLNGNLTASAGGANYTWDAANRLTQFQSAQVTESYAYDAQNRRVWRRDGAGNEFVALYGIDGQLANEYGLGNHPSGGVCYWGAGLGNVRLGTQLLWKSTGMEVSDRLGSTAGAGSGFYPYGEAKAGTPASARYATYGRDTTGLHYALNRYYDPRQGRFLNPDPYEASAGPADPQSWNRYAYVQNDPVNRADPTGLLFCSAEFSHCQGLGASPFMDTGGSLGGGGWNWGASIGGIFSISIWAFPWPTPAPIPAPEPEPEPESEEGREPFCTVELWYRPLAIGGTGQNHAYLRVSATVSGTTIWDQIEAGPSDWVTPPGARAPIRFLVPQNYSDAASYHKRPDNHQHQAPITSRDDSGLCDKVVSLGRGIEHVRKNPVQYSAVGGPNSNSYINYLLTYARISWWQVAPPDVWAWNVKLYA